MRSPLFFLRACLPAAALLIAATPALPASAIDLTDPQPPPRDAWYLEQPTLAFAPLTDLSAQARDRWYVTDESLPQPSRVDL